MKFSISDIGKKMLSFQEALAKLEYGNEHEVAPEAEQIINRCIEELEELL